MAQVHIGKKIKEVIDKSHLTVTDVTEFAKKINRTRDVAYKIFAKENIDTAQLRQISKVLDHDFFSYLSNELPGVKEEKQGYGKKAEADEFKAIKKQLVELEKKYELLEELHQLTKEKLRSLKKKKSKK